MILLMNGPLSQPPPLPPLPNIADKSLAKISLHFNFRATRNFQIGKGSLVNDVTQILTFLNPHPLLHPNAQSHMYLCHKKAILPPPPLVV